MRLNSSGGTKSYKLVGASIFLVGGAFVAHNYFGSAGEKCRKLASSPFESHYEGVEEFQKIDLDAAFEACSVAANQAYASSADQFRFGRVFFAKGDYDAAFEWTKKAADQNYAPAQLRLGMMYYNGRGVEQSFLKAAEWFHKAADQDYAPAEFMNGVQSEGGKGFQRNAKTAIGWYRAAAEKEYAPAQLSLGNMFRKGDGVAKDAKEAVAWYRKAANQNYAPAQYILGVMYANGEGTTKDGSEAAQWYGRAAEQQYAPAQFELANMYASGSGIAKNDEIAVEWYRRAADQGHAGAQYWLGLAYSLGRGATKDLPTGVNWLRKAADQDHRDAQFEIGVAFNQGLGGLSKDQDQAEKYFMLAARQGHLRAHVELGLLYLASDKGKEARSVFFYPAERGDADAQFQLGRTFQHGLGIGKDLRSAEAWYKRAAKQGHAGAKQELSLLAPQPSTAPRQSPEITDKKNPNSWGAAATIIGGLVVLGILGEANKREEYMKRGCREVRQTEPHDYSAETSNLCRTSDGYHSSGGLCEKYEFVCD